MYYPSSENKGVDQLRGYREAGLRLCFRIGNNPVFLRCGSNCPLIYFQVKQYLSVMDSSMIFKWFNCSGNVESFLGLIKGLGKLSAAWSGSQNCYITKACLCN